MRYRVFQNEQFLGTFPDRQAFHEAYSGEKPNSPTKGDTILLDEKTYVVNFVYHIGRQPYIIIIDYSFK